MMKATAVLFLVCVLLASVASARVVWNVTLPYPTASPVNGEEAPTPHSVISKVLGLYAYVDTGYYVNVVNMSSGAHLWAARAQGSLGLQFSETHGQLIFNSLSANTLQGRDARTGAVIWNQAQNFTANLPAFIWKDRYLTAQLQTGEDAFFLYQVDITTGNTTWQVQGAADVNGECGEGITIFNSADPQYLNTFGTSLKNGSFAWVSPWVWGRWIGCLRTSGGQLLAAIKNNLAATTMVSIIDPHTGVGIRNISVMKHFHAYEVFGVTGSIFCAKVETGEFTNNVNFFVQCYDGETGANTLTLNVTASLLQQCFILNGHVVLLRRDYATSGAVVLTAYNASTGALAWNITAVTPYTDDTYYVPGNAMIGSYIVVNHDDGFTALSHRKSFNVSGLGPTVRVDSILTTDDFDRDVVLTTRTNGIRLSLPRS